MSPPPPFEDFGFAFDPNLTNLFPAQLPLPHSAGLFEPNESDYLDRFLDDFSANDDFSYWDFANPQEAGMQQQQQQQQQRQQHMQHMQRMEHFEHTEHLPASAPYSNPHLQTTPDASTSGRPRRSSRAVASRSNHGHEINASQMRLPTPSREGSQSRSTDSTSTTPTAPTSVESPVESTANGRSKPLLSTPQKRLNHIMSEQKRRNAIRDSYAQLISLLAPAGSAQGIGMPTRGRPKGSGNSNKGQTKGKSGVLFRAVEYCKWLEEGRDALQAEVAKVEAALGIQHP